MNHLLILQLMNIELLSHNFVFHFDLFVFEGYNKDKHKGDVRGLKLTTYEPAITCYRYPGMEDKNHALLRDFLKWVEMRELLPYLQLTESDG